MATRSSTSVVLGRTEARPILELSGITAGYGRTTALWDVSFVASTGTIVALLGPNGAGKTTLLRVAAGLLRPDRGRVLLAGNDVTRETPARRSRSGLCLIPEGRGVFPSLSVRENLTLQIPPWATDRSIDQALEAFPVLGQRLGQRAGGLSGGQQQMLALARCFLSGASVVLLDEVSMGLAPRIVDEIFHGLTTLAAQDVTLVIVEQYINRALEMAETVCLINRGRVVYSGSSDRLDEDAVLEGYLGADLGRDSSDRTAEDRDHGAD
jgi:branched-chain amino acid transport system ATP-binding protein